MKKQFQNPKVIAGTATGLFLLTLLTTGIYYSKNQSLKDSLGAEKVLTEQLTTEKQRLIQDIQTFRNDLEAMKDDNHRLDGMLEEANNKLAQKEKSISKLNKENKSIQQQLEEVQKMRDELNNEMNSLKQTISQLEDENKLLSQTNASLMLQIKQLNDKLIVPSAKANNFKVEVLRKKKDKLTVSARKTHVVSVSFDYNTGALAHMGEEKIYLVVTDKDGNVLKSDSSGKTSVILEGVQKDIEFSVVETSKNNQPEMNFRFEPHDELKAGVYGISVYTGNSYLGSSKFRLVK